MPTAIDAVSPAAMPLRPGIPTPAPSSLWGSVLRVMLMTAAIVAVSCLAVALSLS